jgi:hypothetical protein
MGDKILFTCRSKEASELNAACIKVFFSATEAEVAPNLVGSGKITLGQLTKDEADAYEVGKVYELGLTAYTASSAAEG